MLIATRRFILRDLIGADRPAFIAYQMDERYLRLYDFDANNTRRANDLFDRFLNWRAESPRHRFQLGIFEPTGRLCGSAGLRVTEDDAAVAILGIELAPDDWGRYRLAIEVAAAMVGFGFNELQLEKIAGDTASGNRRVAKLAAWFGAKLTAVRPGPTWMEARNWREVDWELTREDWLKSHARRR